MGARRSRDGWAGLLAAFAKSKLTTQEFCAERRIKERTFRWWTWKLRTTPADASLVRMLPVAIAESPSAPMRVAVSEVTGEVQGIVVRVPVGIDTKFAAALIAELRARC